MKPAQKLISIEHNERWYFAVRNELVDVAEARFDYRFCPSTNDRWVHLSYGHPVGELPNSMFGYIWGHEVGQRSAVDSGDVFFVDGVCRGAVLSVLAMRAKQDAAIFLHDSERPWYSWATRLLIERQQYSGKRFAGGQHMTKYERRV